MKHDLGKLFDKAMRDELPLGLKTTDLHILAKMTAAVALHSGSPPGTMKMSLEELFAVAQELAAKYKLTGDRIQ